MKAGPPRPRPFPAGEHAKIGTGGARKLTAPEAYALYCGALGYHLPRHLNNASRLSQALSYIR